MRSLIAALAAAVPLVALAQEGQPPSPADPAAPSQAVPQGPPAATPPPQYAPPPQGSPPSPQFAPPQGYPPPPGYPPPQYAPPPPQYAPQYAPPPQYAQPPSPGQYPPPQYAPPGQYPPPGAPPFPPQPWKRSPWYAAASVGGGDGNVRLETIGPGGHRTSSLHEYFGKGPSTFAFDLQVGVSLTRKLLLGGEAAWFLAAAEYERVPGASGTATRSLGISTLNAVMTLYPFDRGPFLKAGLGFASFTAVNDVPGLGKTTTRASGGDVALGAGWALWLGQRFNLSLNLDWSRQSYRGNEVAGSAFWRAGLGLGWY